MAEIAPQSQSGIGSYGPLAFGDFIDPARRNAEVSGQSVLSDTHRLEKLFSQNSPGVMVAMKLKAWRYKDRLHISHLLDSGVVLDTTTFPEILQRYQLDEQWKQLQADRAKSA